MAPEGNGCAWFLRLEQHYLGTEHTARRAADAEARLRKLHYKNESVFKFEDYITGLYEVFEMLEDNNQGWHNAQKVNKLLAGIQSNNPEITGLKPLICKEYPNDFEAAATQLAGQILLIYSKSNNDAEGRNKRRISAVDKNHHGGHRRQRGGRNNRQNMINGVDVSNPNHNFSGDEWHKLRDSGMMAWIIARRNTNRQGQNRGQGCRGGSGRGNQGGGRNNNRAGRGYNSGNEQNRRVQIAGATVMGEENAIAAGHGNNNAQQPAPARGGQHGARFGGRHPGGRR
jgi:hypothetical protein